MYKGKLDIPLSKNQVTSYPPYSVSFKTTPQAKQTAIHIPACTVFYQITFGCNLKADFCTYFCHGAISPVGLS